MRAWIFSDLHIGLPRSKPTLPVPDADVCICAGAILTRGPAQAVSYLGHAVSNQMPVIFVPGNADYHGRAILEGRAEALDNSVQFPNVHFLDRAEVTVGGIRFVGATLWGDDELSISPRLSLYIARRNARDSLKIKMSLRPRRRLSAQQLDELGGEDRRFLKETLETTSGTPTVVVTHHTPSRRSIAPGLLSEAPSQDGALGLEEIIVRHGPVAWIHGNLDRRNDYLIADTRVISNPRGYPDRPVRDFDPCMIIDLQPPPMRRRKQLRTRSVASMYYGYPDVGIDRALL